MKLIIILLLLISFTNTMNILLARKYIRHKKHQYPRLFLNITDPKDSFMKCMLMFKKYSDIGVDEYEMQIPVSKLELFGRKGIIPYMQNISDTVMNRFFTDKIVQIARVIQVVYEFEYENKALEEQIDIFGQQLQEESYHIAKKAVHSIEKVIKDGKLSLNKNKKYEIEYVLESKQHEITNSLYDDIFYNIKDLDKKLLHFINQQMDMDEQKKPEDAKCTSNKQMDIMSKELQKDLSTVANPFENCRNMINKEFPDNNMRYVPLNQMNLHMLYEMKKCKKIQDNNAKTSIENILDDYEWIKETAYKLRCMAKNSRVGQQPDYFLYEMGTAEMVISLFAKYK